MFQYIFVNPFMGGSGQVCICTETAWSGRSCMFHVCPLPLAMHFDFTARLLTHTLSIIAHGVQMLPLRLKLHFSQDTQKRPDVPLQGRLVWVLCILCIDRM